MVVQPSHQKGGRFVNARCANGGGFIQGNQQTLQKAG
jgi:hypothetical protein